MNSGDKLTMAVIGFAVLWMFVLLLKFTFPPTKVVITTKPVIVWPKRRRVNVVRYCGKHTRLAVLGILAIVDDKNCDACKRKVKI